MAALAVLPGLVLVVSILRRRPQPDWSADDVDPAVIERYGLTPGEAVQVQHAMARGRRLPDPRLRTATVEAARSFTAAHPDGSRWLSWLLVAALVVMTVVAAVRGRWTVVPIAWVLEMTLLQTWLAGAPRRAIGLNSGPD